MKKGYKPPSTAFDTSAFTFDTKVTDLLAALARCEAELTDLLEYRVPSHEQKKRINELIYWVGTWEYSIMTRELEGVETVKTCAIENRVLGLYTGKPKKGKSGGKQK